MATDILDGFKELSQDLERVQSRINDKAVENILLTNGEIFRADAARIIGSLTERHTGDLINSIIKKPVNKYVYISWDHAIAIYGPIHEFGSVKMAARPHMIVSYYKNKERVENNIKQQIEKMI